MADGQNPGMGSKIGRSGKDLGGRFRKVLLPQPSADGSRRIGAAPKLLAIGVAVAIIAAMAVAVPTVLSGGAPAASLHVYNVTFTLQSEMGPSFTGSQAYSSSGMVNFDVAVPYLAGIGVTASYQDQSTSPVTDPQVSLHMAGPPELGGDWIILVPAQGTTLVLAPFNPLPENTTVEALSPEAAVSNATATDMNETLGHGDWTGELQVGSAAGGRLRPGGSVSYSIQLEFWYVVVEATALP